MRKLNGLIFLFVIFVLLSACSNADDNGKVDITDTPAPTNVITENKDHDEGLETENPDLENNTSKHDEKKHNEDGVNNEFNTANIGEWT